MRIPHKGTQKWLIKDMTIEELYEKEKDQEDGFLYIKYSNMEPFGAKPWKVLQRELDLHFCIYVFFKK